MSDEKKSDPVDDLKQGLGLLFRAAKGAVEKIPTDKVEDVAKDAAKEVARAFETIGHEVEKVISPNKKSSEAPPAQAEAKGGSTPPATATGTDATGEAKPPEPPKYDDAYAPDPPKR